MRSRVDVDIAMCSILKKDDAGGTTEPNVYTKMFAVVTLIVGVNAVDLEGVFVAYTGTAVSVTIQDGGGCA
ncbi:hypothetical protein PoB_007444700 [Plakobranchus ocellatus]|uniref:Uncharacterized protein n=1 Tax=Plakobranchus ocellatus TaxID=259542 RepID=A0AAV4DUF5_9GAST|nr:hypothetical protein PoB_007444700 [Plakobranchus ocellatus]